MSSEFVKKKKCFYALRGMFLAILILLWLWCWSFVVTLILSLFVTLTSDVIGWNWEPHHRPTFAEIHRAFETMFQNSSITDGQCCSTELSSWVTHYCTLVRDFSHILQGSFAGINTLRLRQNGHHFSDDIFRCIFLKENIWILNTIWLNFLNWQ